MYILYIALTDVYRNNPKWISNCIALGVDPNTAPKQALATQSRIVNKRKHDEMLPSSNNNNSPTCPLCHKYYKKLIHTIDDTPGCCIECRKKRKKNETLQLAGINK